MLPRGRNSLMLARGVIVVRSLTVRPCVASQPPRYPRWGRIKPRAIPAPFVWARAAVQPPWWDLNWSCQFSGSGVASPGLPYGRAVDFRLALRSHIPSCSPIHVATASLAPRTRGMRRADRIPRRWG